MAYSFLHRERSAKDLLVLVESVNRHITLPLTFAAQCILDCGVGLNSLCENVDQSLNAAGHSSREAFEKVKIIAQHKHSSEVTIKNVHAHCSHVLRMNFE
jgi:hypothetical protein